jgi:hypothetical protein
VLAHSDGVVGTVRPAACDNGDVTLWNHVALQQQRAAVAPKYRNPGEVWRRDRPDNGLTGEEWRHVA